MKQICGAEWCLGFLILAGGCDRLQCGCTIANVLCCVRPAVIVITVSGVLSSAVLVVTVVDGVHLWMVVVV